MKYISICSGIEAASTAWHSLGWTPLAFSEIEPFPSAVLAERYPSVPNLGDMSKYREWPEELLAECDLLVGGTPCQAFSVAGLRKSLDDDRGNLSLVYVQMFHHINEVRKRHGRQPAIALWENVPGVLSTKDNAFGCFISGLLGVDDTVEVEGGKWPKAGFLGSETVRVGYRVLDAQYFAVAQRRRRVFLVAVPCELVTSLGERACPSEILSLRESVLGNPPARSQAGSQETAGTLGASSSDWSRSEPKGAFIAAAFTKSKRAQSNTDDETWVSGEVSPTMSCFDQGDTRATTVAVLPGMAVRRLTPLEFGRLQGFPDDHCDITFRKKPAADGPKYRALGNSMAVPCMAWLGWRIQKATEQE